MELKKLLHPKIKRLLTHYDLEQRVLDVEKHVIRFERAKLLIDNDRWHSFTICNNTYTITINHRKDTEYVLCEFVFNTDIHTWEKIEEQCIYLTEHDITLCL